VKKILLVEDEQNLADIIKLNLELDGYLVEHVVKGTVAFGLAAEIDNFDLVILDVMLPEVSGITICREYRKHASVPILFLSAKGTTQDRIMGLKAGGNDYLPKPFDLEELLLKVQILTNGTEGSSAEEVLERYVINQQEINFLTFEITDLTTNQRQLLSKREIELLKLFIKNKDRIVSREEILTELWDANQYPTARTIDNYILTFRKIFESNPRHPEYFHSIRSVGYRFSHD
jgi:two-component system alkaline phosphatase synthesis response regulator PhoP